MNIIPLICEFMKKLGECTETGNLLRAEEKQLVSLLIKAWFQGSPGVGKSVLTCMLAFYLATKRRKSVFLYRKIAGAGLDNCILYLKHDGGKVEYFYDNKCNEQKAIEIYDELIRQHDGIENP